MKRIIFTFATILLGIASFFLLYQYNTQRILQDNIQKAIENTGDTMMINNFDSSSRLTDKALTMKSIQLYEQEFIENFRKNNTFNTIKYDVVYSFDYLVVNQHGHHVHVDSTYELRDLDVVKAVNNHIEIENKKHTIRMIVDESKGR